MCVHALWIVEWKWIIARSELQLRLETSVAEQSPKNIEFKIFEIEFSHNYVYVSVLVMSI